MSRIAAFALMTALSAPALAQPAPPTRAAIERERGIEFTALDANRDGKADAFEITARFRSLADQTVAQARSDRTKSFYEMDSNGDGLVSLSEYEAVIPLPNPQVPDAKAILSMFDKDGDGELTPTEFAAPSLAMFDKADINRDGVLSPEEERVANSGSGRP